MPYAIPVPRLVLILLLTLVLGALAFFAWQRFFPAQTSSDWSASIRYEGIEKAAAITLDEQGDLLVAEERNHNRGRILRIDEDGERTVVLDGLNKPNGMVAFRGGIAISQEGGDHPVYWLRDGQLTPLFRGRNVQGLAVSGDYLYAVEDRKRNGRILRYDASSGETRVIRDGLSEAETFAICPNGRRFYSKKALGQIRELRDDGHDSIYLDGLTHPSYLRCDDNGLWISEDSTHRARLLRSPLNGETEVVMTFLRAPQMLFGLGGERYLLAEGGRDRVLELELSTTH